MSNGDHNSLHSLDSLPQAAVALNGEGWLVYGNPAAQQLLGYDAAGLAESHFSDLIASDPLWLQSEFANLKEQMYWAGRLHLCHQQGAVIPASINALALSSRATMAYLYFISPGLSTAEKPGVVSLAEIASQLGLTWRDLHLLQLISEGLSEEQIARLRGASPEIVTNEIKGTLRHMKVASKTVAVITAIKAGLIL